MLLPQAGARLAHQQTPQGSARTSGRSSCQASGKASHRHQMRADPERRRWQQWAGGACCRLMRSMPGLTMSTAAQTAASRVVLARWHCPSTGKHNRHSRSPTGAVAGGGAPCSSLHPVWGCLCTPQAPTPRQPGSARWIGKRKGQASRLSCRAQRGRCQHNYVLPLPRPIAAPSLAGTLTWLHCTPSTVAVPSHAALVGLSSVGGPAPGPAAGPATAAAAQGAAKLGAV